MSSLEAFALGKLEGLEGRRLRRRLVETRREEPPFVMRGGRRLVSLSCNDVLGLSRHPAVVRAAVEATARWGTGAGASRLLTGHHPELVALEEALARWEGTAAACVFGSGYLANLGVVPALVGTDDLVLADALSHACLLAGAALSGARLVRFGHNDMGELRRVLEAERGRHQRCLVLTETVFSMDGDRAPLGEMARLAERHDAWLLADGAHGVGLAIEEVERVPLRVGTLSKALGGYGGFLCASEAVVALMHSRARSLVYSTGLPPGVAAAARAAIEVVVGEPGLRERPWRLARLFTALTGRPEAASHIVPVMMGAPEAALRAQARLEAHGFLAAAIRPPTVPEGTSRLRLSFPAAMGEAEVERLAALLPC